MSYNVTHFHFDDLCKITTKRVRIFGSATSTTINTCNKMNLLVVYFLKYIKKNRL
jgi:hypothetical protein